MWPLERMRGRDIVRVGRDRVERWGPSPQGLILKGRQSLSHAGKPNASSLTPAVNALFKDAEIVRDVDLVLESAWLPVMLLQVGTALWSTTQVEALLRHRLGQLYPERGEPMSAWEVQLDYRAGDARGLGYGLSPSVKDALATAAATTGCRWTSLQPAFAWGWQRCKARGRSARLWWIWTEQDRALVARVEAGRLIDLNPGVTLPRDESQWTRLIDIEALRFGVSSDDAPITVAAWQTPSSEIARRPLRYATS